MCKLIWEEVKVLKGKNLLTNSIQQNIFFNTDQQFSILFYNPDISERYDGCTGKSSSVICSISECICISAGRRIMGYSLEKSSGVILISSR